MAEQLICSAAGQSDKTSRRRTCLKRQTKQRPKFALLSWKKWEIQYECVGKLVNHCCVAKRDNQRLHKAKWALLSTADKNFT